MDKPNYSELIEEWSKDLKTLKNRAYKYAMMGKSIANMETDEADLKDLLKTKLNQYKAAHTELVLEIHALENALEGLKLIKEKEESKEPQELNESIPN